MCVYRPHQQCGLHIYVYMFQYVTLCVCIALISSAVYVHSSSIIKLLLLSVLALLYICLVELTLWPLFDNRDILVRTNVGSVYMIEYVV